MVNTNKTSMHIVIWFFFITIKVNSIILMNYPFKVLQTRSINSSYDSSLLLSQYQGIKKSRCLAQCAYNLYCAISVFQPKNKTCKIYYQPALSYQINDSLSTLYIIGRTPLQTTTTITTTTTTTTAQPITNGLTNYWPIINGSLSDQVGSASVSSVSSISYGSNRLLVSNDAVFINNGYMNLPTGSYISGNLTIMMWIKVLQLPNASIAIFDCGKGSFPNDDILLAIDQNGFLFTEIYYNTGVIGGNNALNTLPLNTWSHVALTWDGTIAIIYINGVIGSSTSSITSSSLNSIPRNRCGFGLDYSSDSATLNAYLDEIRIYSRSLSQLEINTQYLVNL